MMFAIIISIAISIIIDDNNDNIIISIMAIRIIIHWCRVGVLFSACHIIGYIMCIGV